MYCIKPEGIIITLNVQNYLILVACQKVLDKQDRPRSDCFWRSSLIRVFPVCYSDKHFVRERSGSVVECLTRDRKAAGLSLTRVTGRNFPPVGFSPGKEWAGPFFPRVKNRPAHSSPPPPPPPPNNLKNHNEIIISLHKFKKLILN